MKAVKERQGDIEQDYVRAKLRKFACDGSEILDRAGLIAPCSRLTAIASAMPGSSSTIKILYIIYNSPFGHLQPKMLHL